MGVRHYGLTPPKKKTGRGVMGCKQYGRQDVRAPAAICG
jgi:hypothetical protein